MDKSLQIPQFRYNLDHSIPNFADSLLFTPTYTPSISHHKSQKSTIRNFTMTRI